MKLKPVKNAFLASGALSILVTALDLILSRLLEFIPNAISSPYVNNFIWNLMLWDSNLEPKIVGGYFGSPSMVVKYPMFSMIASVIQRLAGLINLPMGDTQAIFWAAKLGLFFGLIAIYILTSMIIREKAAKRIPFLIAFSVFGGGYTWFMAYPESWDLLFFSLALICFYGEEYTFSGLVMGLGSITRPQSIALVPILGLSFVIFKIRKGGWKALWETNMLTQLAFVVGPGLFTYSAWNVIASNMAGAPFAPITGQRLWGRGVFEWPWQRIAELYQRFADTMTGKFIWFVDLYQIGTLALGALVIAYLTLRGKFRWEIALYSLIVLIVPLTTDFTGLGRFALCTGLPLVLVMFPEKYDKYFLVIGIFFTVVTLMLFLVGNAGFAFRP